MHEMVYKTSLSAGAERLFSTTEDGRVYTLQPVINSSYLTHMCYTDALDDGKHDVHREQENIYCRTFPTGTCAPVQQPIFRVTFILA